MQGKRIYPNEDGDLIFTEPGEYGQHPNGTWLASLPRLNKGTGRLMPSNLASHTIIEHEDGTITVSPSILVTDWNADQWHGWLVRGEWREA